MVGSWIRCPVTLGLFPDKEAKHTLSKMVIFIKRVDELLKVEGIMRVLLVHGVKDPLKEVLDLDHQLTLEIATHWTTHGEQAGLSWLVGDGGGLVGCKGGGGLRTRLWSV